jgi:hypothetical protein
VRVVAAVWSGRRGSNPRRPAWEAGILPLNYSRLTNLLPILELSACKFSVQHQYNKNSRSDGELVGGEGRLCHSDDRLTLFAPFCKPLRVRGYGSRRPRPGARERPVARPMVGLGAEFNPSRARDRKWHRLFYDVAFALRSSRF